MQRESRHMIIMAVDIIVCGILIAIIGFMLSQVRQMYSYKSTYDGNIQYMSNVSTANRFLGSKQSISDIIDMISTYDENYAYAIIGDRNIVSTVDKADLKDYVTVNDSLGFIKISSLTIENLSNILYINAGYSVEQEFNGKIYNRSGELTLKDMDSATLIVFRLD